MLQVLYFKPNRYFSTEQSNKMVLFVKIQVANSMKKITASVEVAK